MKRAPMASAHHHPNAVWSPSPASRLADSQAQTNVSTASAWIARLFSLFPVRILANPKMGIRQREMKASTIPARLCSGCWPERRLPVDSPRIQRASRRKVREIPRRAASSRLIPSCGEPDSFQKTRNAEVTSIRLSRPNPVRATELAGKPSERATTASATFHEMVATDSWKASRCKLRPGAALKVSSCWPASA